jgi:hypothetical protein
VVLGKRRKNEALMKPVRDLQACSLFKFTVSGMQLGLWQFVLRILAYDWLTAQFGFGCSS